jgi:hypothetical protein
MLAPAGLARVLAQQALEVEIQLVTDLDEVLEDETDGVVIVTDDAQQLDRSARLPRVQVMHVVAG